VTLMTIFLIVYAIGLVIIYISSAIIEKRSPGKLKSDHDEYTPLLIMGTVWPLTITCIIGGAVSVLVLMLISWPWRAWVLGEGLIPK